MKIYNCKLCYKVIANGRALGCHMGSHFANLAVPPTTSNKTDQFSEPTKSSSSLSLSQQYVNEKEEEEERGNKVKALAYELRENPKRSFKLADPKFSERKSETESARNPARQHRVKRIRKMGLVENQELERPRNKLSKPSSTESVDELEEECVARCLMMLSGDTSRREWSTDSEQLGLSQSTSQCETCKKVFNSFQALGGHRTSRKSCNISVERGERVHKCPICYNVLGSGQALGGHKRSHFLDSSSSSKELGQCLVEKNSETLIDLNLPVPREDVEDDDSNLIEASALSDCQLTN